MRIAVYALLKRVSALTAFTLASAMCRAAPSSRWRIVCFDGVTVSRLTPTKFCKLIVVANQEDFGLG